MKKKILLAVLIFAFLFMFLMFYAWYRAHEKLAVHVSPGIDTPVKYKLPYEKRSFKTTDNIRISSWYIPVKNPKAVVILIHGFQDSKGGKSLMLSQAKYLYDAGYSTFLIDLRSMGYSPGNHVTLGVNEWKDAVAAYDYMESLPENKNKKIGFYGHSMGAVTALIAKGITGKGDFVIATVPYANFPRLFSFQVEKQGLPAFIFAPFLRISSLFELGLNYDYYSPVNWIGKIHVPVLLVSALRDSEVNSADAKILYNEGNNPKELWVVDSGHDISRYKPRELKMRILDFLREKIK